MLVVLIKYPQFYLQSARVKFLFVVKLLLQTFASEQKSSYLM
jgi:hypothetical protein